MKTITSVLLVNTLRATVDHIEETTGLDSVCPGLIELKRTLTSKLSQLQDGRFIQDAGTTHDQPAT